MNPFQSLRDYEEFVYTLRQHFPSIQGSTLMVARRGKRMATLQGEIAFVQGYRITLKERLSFDEGPVVIEDYGYESSADGKDADAKFHFETAAKMIEETGYHRRDEEIKCLK